MIKNFIKKALSTTTDANENKDKLLNFEGKIGGSLFEQPNDNRKREFFCLDEYTWVWYEEWSTKFGKRQSLITRYDIQSNGVFKIQPNMPRRRLSDEELSNFYEAVKLYSKKVIPELQKLII